MITPFTYNQQYQENQSSVNAVQGKECSVFVTNLADFSGFDYLEYLNHKKIIKPGKHVLIQQN